MHEDNEKINNNVALAQDAKGRELIVFGKGVGFPATPYELTDLSRVQRTFYDVDEKYFDLLRDVPQEVFLAADDAPGIPPGICLCGAGHRVPGKNYHWHCTNEEQLYLLMHIHRVQAERAGAEE